MKKITKERLPNFNVTEEGKRLNAAWYRAQDAVDRATRKREAAKEAYLNARSVYFGNACRKCLGKMVKSKALLNTLVGYPDFPGDTGIERGCTISRTGPPEMIDVMKCNRCGWSVKA